MSPERSPVPRQPEERPAQIPVEITPTPGGMHSNKDLASPRLLPEQLADLRKSGLADHTIHEAQIANIPQPLLPEYLVGFARPGVTAYLIPYPHSDPSKPFYRAKLMPPQRSADGHTVKYIQEPGTSTCLFFGAKAWEQRQDVNQILYIVEGEKKTLKMEQEGYACVGIGGLWNWVSARQPIADLKKINFARRRTVIVPDGDVWLDPAKKQPIYALGQELLTRGATIEAVQLPALPGVDKVGVDDYLVRLDAQSRRAQTRRIDIGVADQPALPRLDDESGANKLSRHPITPRTTNPIWLAERRWYEVWRKKAAASAESNEPPPLTLQQRAELAGRCATILNAADPLDLIGQELRRIGYGGRITPPKIVYLAMQTRLLPKRRGSLPYHTQVNGPAGTGKTYLLRCVLALHPVDVYAKHDAGSPRVMVYDPAPLKHRVLVYTEADSVPGVAAGTEDNPAASMIRTLLADGEATYETVEKVDGQMQRRKITKEGPTVLITTTVNRLSGDQLDSRMSAVEVPESYEQQMAALRAQSTVEEDGEIPEPDSQFLAFQAYLQSLAPIDVRVPFVRALFSLMGVARRSDARLLRDAQRILSFVKAIAIVRIARRSREAKGRVVATHDDYQTAVTLADESYTATATGATEKIRQLWAALPECGSLTYTQLANRLGITRQAIAKRVKDAQRHGWVVNEESRAWCPARIARGETLPHRSGLPTLKAITEWQPPRRTPADPD